MTATQLPYNADAESGIIQALFSSPDFIAECDDLKSEHFYIQRLSLIYTAIRAVHAAGDTITVLLVAEAMRKAGTLDKIGGKEGLLSIIADEWLPSWQRESYLRIVIESAARRTGIIAAGKIAALYYDESQPLDQQHGEATAILTATTMSSVTDIPAPIGEALNTWFTSIGSGQKDGVCTPTGYRDLDSMLVGGLWKGDLTILAARPGVGKTALALSIADAIAATDRTVLLFSLEMPTYQLINRIISFHTKIDAARLRAGNLGEQELAASATAVGALYKRPFYIDDKSNRTIAEIRAIANRMRQQAGDLGLVVIDYLGLIRASERYKGDRNNEVAEISRALKALAKELDAPVLALHQLSRAVEGRTSHIPMLSDLRDSGAIEQDADVVMFIYREELYDPETDKKGIAEIHIAKHRNGPLGVVPMRFNSELTHFESLTYFKPMEGY